MLGDRKTVVLRGGAPWGFRLAGGGQIPVYIAKVFSNCFSCSTKVISLRFEAEVRPHLVVLQLVIRSSPPMVYPHFNNHYVKSTISSIQFVIN